MLSFPFLGTGVILEGFWFLLGLLTHLHTALDGFQLKMYQKRHNPKVLGGGEHNFNKVCTLLLLQLRPDRVDL